MQDDVTQILLEVTAGKRERLNELFLALYDELRIVAANALKKERSNHSMQPTALVHHVYLQMVNQSRVDWKSRSHFCAIASTIMRRILVDHARARLTEKRGGGRPMLSLITEPAVMATNNQIDLVALDGVLTHLAELNPRHAKIIELRFFGGLSIDETAQVMEVSTWTVKNEWRVARAWLLAQLDGHSSDDA